MIFNHLPISAYSGVTVLKFDMKIFVNVARLEIGQLFTQGTRQGHPCTLDIFLVLSILLGVGGDDNLIINFLWPKDCQLTSKTIVSKDLE